MIAPTDRSMPAVRMTSVCAAPRIPTIGDLLQDQRQGAGGEELALEHRAGHRDTMITSTIRTASPEWRPVSGNAENVWMRRSRSCDIRRRRPMRRADPDSTFSNSCEALVRTTSMSHS
jgi:hypothetical protein